MRNHISPATHFGHLDIASGTLNRIPLGYHVSFQPYILGVMRRSQEAGNRAIVYTDSLLLEANLGNAGWGVASMGLVAQQEMGRGIKPGTRLAFGTCAVSALYSESTYEILLCNYLNGFLATTKARMMSPPDEPAAHPWGASFFYPIIEGQDDKFRYQLKENVRTMLAAAINHCRGALARNEAAQPGEGSGPTESPESGPA